MIRKGGDLPFLHSPFRAEIIKLVRILHLILTSQT